jgi:predicted Zn-dependent protease with MMP-like domain
MNIDQQQFEQIVSEALDSLPERFRERINNLAVLVEDFPNKDQMRDMKLRDRFGLFGLYEGYVQSSRHNFGPVLPDRITIFRVPIIESCDTTEECRMRIIETVKHEIAHHFGSDEKGARQAAKRKIGLK